MYDYNNGADTRGRGMELHRDEAGRVSRDPHLTYAYALDPATGMPVIEEDGAYFRIKVAGPKATAKYMRKRWWWFDKVMCTQYMETLGQKLEADDILWLALTAIEQRDRDLRAARQRAGLEARLKQKKLDADRHNARFNGDYPPKKLEEVSGGTKH